MKRVLTLAAVLLAAPAARAQVVDPQDYPVERLKLAMDADGILDSESATVPADGTWSAGLWLGFAKDPLIGYAGSEGGDRAGALVDDRVGGTLGFAYAAKGWLEAGLELPVILYQTRDSMLTGSGSLGSLSSTGIGDVRVVPKVKVWHGPVDLAVLPIFTLPTGGHDNYFGESSLTFAPTVAVTRAQGALRFGGNLAYLTRKNSADAGLTVEDEILLRAGVGYHTGKLDVAGGLSGALPASAPIGNHNANALELLADAGYSVGAIDLYGGAGVGIESGYGVPDFRLFIGTRYTGRHETKKAPPPVDKDSDGDGLLDSVDQCKDDPEDKDSFEDDDGCPDTDNDKDTFPDTEDQCPNDAETVNGYQDDDGCPDAVPDTDGDGLLDDKDQCIDQPEDADGFQDDDGCPDPDNDADTVLDPDDGCPVEAGPPENKGCPDADRDGDTVVDRLDSCPDEPGTVANHGCKEKQAVEIQTGGFVIHDTIQFDKKKATIKKASYKLLKQIAAVMRAHTEITSIEIAGYTSSEGDDAFNLDLSQRRAESVMTFLTDQGVDAARLTAKGYGEADPLADNASHKGRVKNRRVEFHILNSQPSQ